MAPCSSQVKHMPRKRITATARFLKPLKEPCLIFVAANGDVLNPAVRLLIPQQTLGQFERVLEMITEKMSLRVLGGVHSLYTFNGVLVNDGKDLENGQFYVAVGREKFKKLPYSDLIFTKPARRKFTGSKAASLPPIYGMEKLNDAGRHQSKSMVGCSDSSGSKASPGPRSNKEAQSQEHLMRLRPGKSGLTLSFGTRDVEDGDQTEDGSGGDPHPEEGWNGRVPTGQNQVESANENEGTLEGDGGRKEGTSKDGKGNTPPEVNGMDVQDSPEAKGREEKSEEGDDTPSSSADGKLEMTEEVVGGSGSDNALSGEKEETIPDSSQEEAGLNGLEGESECEEGAQSVEDAHGYEDASQNGDGERQEA
ncbi:doublecortin domain-containing protein 2 [Arapaima gigas]